MMMTAVNKDLFKRDRRYHEMVVSRRMDRRMVKAIRAAKWRMVDWMRREWRDLVRLAALIAGIEYGMLLMLLLKAVAR